MSTLDSSADSAAEESQEEHAGSTSLLSRLGLGGHKASYDDINVPVILMVGFISSVLTFVSIVGVQALYYGYENSEITRKSFDVVNTPKTEIVREQQDKLATYGHTIRQIDTEDGKAEVTRVTIPLEEAIPQVLEAEKQRQEDANTGDNS